MNKKRLLHIGCGYDNPNKLPKIFLNDSWEEIRMDIDPAVKPDIISSASDLSAIASSSIDAIYSSHNLEHLFDYQVKQCLQECLRVLKRKSGFILITVPDIQAVAQMISDGKLMESIYVSPAGPIRPLDMLYGHQKSIEQGNQYMAHHTAFTQQSLGQHLSNVGFEEVRVKRGTGYDLWAVGVLQANSNIFSWFDSYGI